MLKQPIYDGGILMFDSINKYKQEDNTKKQNDNEKKSTKLSANDVSEEKSENTETVVLQNRINTEGL